MQRSLRRQSYTILNIYCLKYFSSDNFPFNRKILLYSHGGKLRKVDLKINEKKLKKRWTRNFEYIDKRSLFLPFFFPLSSNSIDVKLITALARRRVCHYLYSISWSNMKSIDRTVITTSENEFKRSLLQIKKKNEEIHTHAHKNIILLSNSLEHLEKKTKRFSLPPPTRISIISRSSLLDFFSFFPSSSWNITRDNSHNSNVMNISYCKILFFFYKTWREKRTRRVFFRGTKRGDAINYCWWSCWLERACARATSDSPVRVDRGEEE